jgi:hypothetical protein
VHYKAPTSSLLHARLRLRLLPSTRCAWRRWTWALVAWPLHDHSNRICKRGSSVGSCARRAAKYWIPVLRDGRIGYTSCTAWGLAKPWQFDGRMQQKCPKPREVVSRHGAGDIGRRDSGAGGMAVHGADTKPLLLHCPIQPLRVPRCGNDASAALVTVRRRCHPAHPGLLHRCGR